MTAEDAAPFARLAAARPPDWTFGALPDLTVAGAPGPGVEPWPAIGWNTTLVVEISARGLHWRPGTGLEWDSLATTPEDVRVAQLSGFLRNFTAADSIAIDDWIRTALSNHPCDSFVCAGQSRVPWPIRAEVVVALLANGTLAVASSGWAELAFKTGSWTVELATETFHRSLENDETRAGLWVTPFDLHYWWRGKDAPMHGDEQNALSALAGGAFDVPPNQKWTAVRSSPCLY